MWSTTRVKKTKIHNKTPTKHSTKPKPLCFLCYSSKTRVHMEYKVEKNENKSQILDQTSTLRV